MYRSPKYWAEMKKIRLAHEAQQLARGEIIPKKKLSKPIKQLLKKDLDKKR